MSATTIQKKKSRTEIVPLRVSFEEKSLFKVKAKEAGISVSDFLRRSALEGKIVTKGESSRLDVSIVRELNFLGNNLNQLVKKAHIHNYYSAEHLHRLLSQIEELILHIVEMR